MFVHALIFIHNYTILLLKIKKLVLKIMYNKLTSTKKVAIILLNVLQKKTTTNLK